MAISDRRRAFLSNGLTAAIELDGSIEWFPCPRFDSPSIFSKILDDKKGGYFSVAPEEQSTIETSYIGNSLVLRNVFTGKSGKLEITDFLPLGIPSIVRIFKSDMPFIVTIDPSYNYGMTNPTIENVEDGFTFRNNNTMESFDVRIRGAYQLLDDGIVRMASGSGHILSLYSRDYRYGLFSRKGFVYPDPSEALKTALDYWEGQILSAKKVSEFKDMYYRSIAVMLGLTYAPSGGIIAAATTSLPTVVGLGNNWDYRYVWIRDASYAVEALANAGLLAKAKRLVTFLISVIDPSAKSFDNPLYEVDGTQPPAEEELGWLSGNKKSRPVRIGNAAYLQVQMDTEGTFMHAFYVYTKRSNDIEFLKENWWAVSATARWTMGSWKMKSTSLWEERDTLKDFVHTKVMQWVVLDCAAKLASMVGKDEESKTWKQTGDEINEEVLKDGFSKKLNSFVKEYNGTAVDASLLTLPFYGFVDGTDEKYIGTVDRIVEKLTIKEGLLGRSEQDYEGIESQPFTLVSTWLARAYVRMGDETRAKNAINSLIKYSTDLMLFGERVDAKTTEPLGNFPQLFPHAGMVEAILDFNNMYLYKKG